MIKETKHTKLDHKNTTNRYQMVIVLPNDILNNQEEMQKNE